MAAAGALLACVSPHGFGHAARAAAVLAALARRAPGLELEIWSAVPEWFFRESLATPFRYRAIALDVGLVQRSAVEEDPAATVEALERLFAGDAIERRAREIEALAPAVVLCDLAPLALAAAGRAGVPSVLIENFTWDWIYAGYLAAEPRLAPWIDRLAEIFAGANLRLEAEPVCVPFPGARSMPPIARRPRATPDAVRRRLDVAPGQALVLVSLGGIAWSFENLARWESAAGIEFVVPGGAEREERRGRLHLLPHHSPVHHPDLVAAADVVVGKLGYSTVAESLAAGSRYLYLPRPAFRESAVLARFVDRHLPSEEIALAEFRSGAWVERLPALLGLRRPEPGAADGAERAAEAILELARAS
ncbi:MAG: hypothetical protein U0X73_17395 [Thermoanaerobaculia bacterium]